MRPPPKAPPRCIVLSRSSCFPTLSGLHWPNTHVFYNYGGDGTVTLIHVNYVGCRTYTSQSRQSCRGSPFLRRTNFKFFAINSCSAEQEFPLSVLWMNCD